MRLQTSAILSAVLVAVAMPIAAPAQRSTGAPAAPSPSYAALADVVGTSTIAVDVQIRRATRLRGDLAIGTPAGVSRFLIEADVLGLIRGTQGLPGQVSWLIDLPNAADGRVPRVQRRSRWLVIADPVPGRPAQLRLTGAEAMIPYTPEMDRRLRGILAEMTAPDAAPRITGIGKAFYVPGAIPGESETQIFLTTADGRPVSLSILRRPGETPRWAVALGEMVDDSAAPPAPDSLLWYRLACFLPRTLPDTALVDLDTAAIDAARADYALVLSGLGPCERGAAAAIR